jgi:riboflavin synthase
MFTGIVQGVARVAQLSDRSGLRSFRLELPAGFADSLAVGASVAVDGVCLTVTALHGNGAAGFDVMQQTLALTTLGALAVGSRVNVERAARDGAEIGGHALSGHVDFCARVADVRRPENNHILRLAVPLPWMRYVFAKGYIAVNGASLTVAEAEREPGGAGWFDVWLIPETLRMTTFADKPAFRSFGQTLSYGDVDRLSSAFDHLRGNLTAADLYTAGFAAAALGAAERAFPVLEPTTAEDRTPLARPPSLRLVPRAPEPPRGTHLAGFLASAAVAGLGVVGLWRGRR